MPAEVLTNLGIQWYNSGGLVQQFTEVKKNENLWRKWGSYKRYFANIVGGVFGIPQEERYRIPGVREESRNSGRSFLHSTLGESNSLSVHKFNQGSLIPRLQSGGKIPGYGGGDTVPALLEKGEYVVNKEATSQFLPIIQAMNGGQIKEFARGGRA